MKIRASQTSATWLSADPGELNQRVLLRQREDVPVSDYGTTPEFNNERRVWAKIRQVGATTLHESAQTENAITHYVTIRWLRGISADFELVHNDTVYRIRRARDLNSARRFLLLECEELGAERQTGEMYG